MDSWPTTVGYDQLRFTLPTGSATIAKLPKAVSPNKRVYVGMGFTVTGYSGGSTGRPARLIATLSPGQIKHKSNAFPTRAEECPSIAAATLEAITALLDLSLPLTAWGLCGVDICAHLPYGARCGEVINALAQQEHAIFHRCSSQLYQGNCYHFYQQTKSGTNGRRLLRAYDKRQALLAQNTTSSGPLPEPGTLRVEPTLHNQRDIMRALHSTRAITIAAIGTTERARQLYLAALHRLRMRGRIAGWEEACALLCATYRRKGSHLAAELQHQRWSYDLYQALVQCGIRYVVPDPGVPGLDAVYSSEAWQGME